MGSCGARFHDGRAQRERCSDKAIVWAELRFAKSRSEIRSGIPMQKIERVIETILFQSRWLLAPIYLGLVVCLLLLMMHFGHELFNFVLKIPTAKEADVILGTLSLIDLAFTGNLVVIVIFSGDRKSTRLNSS